MLSLPILKRTEEDEEGIERLSASTRLPSYSKDCRCPLLLQGCETLELLWRPLPQDKGGGSRESSWASATVAGRFVKIWNIDPASEADKRSDPPAEGESVEAGGNECED